MMTVVDNPSRSRFELPEGDRVLGWVDYLPFIHRHPEYARVVDPSLRGQLG